MILRKSGLGCAGVFDEERVAELTTAAYIVALRHCAPSHWLDLQLELWQALMARVAKAVEEAAADDGASDLVLQAEEFLAELAYVAYLAALPHGQRRSFLDLELELHRTFRNTMADAEPERNLTDSCRATAQERMVHSEPRP